MTLTIFLNELTSVETGNTAFSRSPAKQAFQLLMDCYEEDGNPYQNMEQKFAKISLTRTCALLSQVMDQDLPPASNDVYRFWKKRYGNVITISTCKKLTLQCCRSKR